MWVKHPHVCIMSTMHMPPSQKSNKRSMAGTIKGRQKGKAKERSKDAQLVEKKKKKKERVNPSCGRKLSHPQPL